MSVCQENVSIEIFAVNMEISQCQWCYCLFFNLRGKKTKQGLTTHVLRCTELDVSVLCMTPSSAWAAGLGVRMGTNKWWYSSPGSHHRQGLAQKQTTPLPEKLVGRDACCKACPVLCAGCGGMEWEAHLGYRDAALRWHWEQGSWAQGVQLASVTCATGKQILR